MSSAPPASGHRPDRPTLTLLAACLGFVVVILDVSIVNMATKALAGDFGGSVSGLEWVINGYTLTFAAFLLTAGAMGDRFHPGRIFVAGFGLFAAASLACGAAPSLGVLVAARVAQGVGAALIVPSSLSLVNAGFPDPARRARAISLWAAAGGLALALGPVVGGLLVDGLGWRSVFYVNVPLAAVGILLARTDARPAPVRTASRRSLDLPGQLFAVVALGALTAAAVEANSRGLTSATVLGCAALFAVALAGFAVAERRGTDPMLPPRLFRDRTFTATTLVGALLNFAFYGLVFVCGIFFQQAWGYSPTAAGLAFLPMTAAVMAANLASGPLVRRHGARPVLVAGNLLAAVGYLAAAPVVGAHSYAAVAAQFVVAGAGLGLVVPAMTNAMLGAADPAHAGVASGVLNASRQVGGLLGVAVMGLLVGDGAPGQLVPGLRAALLWAGGALAVGALLSAVGVRVTARTAATAPAEARRAPVPVR
ncbi:MFS transporter [Streptomyces mobaraensis NBRC 13819 = DSM 40847]|uniref:Major facilitator superfamily (MFS) multidrug efflux pump n=1 Tax=Streptomyces mobaraensis (strain ATCC 29032 / DSM 40847 / JCM 4168 / NBRC 13819 / NCIMB 11159 / IPCR 16-22) TaxID=1223523 RepID=M3C8P4_STRM1|nr:MFS transporter [Streptomyces mobaraensis]EMF00367.1 major facilitator superfamily (MFS) multidrug efflux pump [Streptomyces mobaraensis NBRC 13819 = DSM 40847]QTT77373.1 MFS transporter [Streptomyces mobaraensis NBRC 13819 = DSM 40847]